MLTIVGGPMFAGKTTWLLDTAKSLSEGTFKLFKPNIDNRYAEAAVVSHNGKSLAAENILIDNPVFPEMDERITSILIDELNFFRPDLLLPEIRKQEKLGRQVMGVGLLYDAQQEVFGATLALSKIADEFIEIFASCDYCGKRAAHTYRKIKSDQQVIVGAAELYGPACSACWPLLSADHTQSVKMNNLFKKPALNPATSNDPAY